MNTKKIVIGTVSVILLYHLFFKKDDTKSVATKKTVQQENNLLFINNYTYAGSQLDIENACKWLVSELNENVRNGESQIFEGFLECEHLFLYRGSVIPPQSLLEHSSFTLLNIATGDRYQFGYSGAQWYFRLI